MKKEIIRLIRKVCDEWSIHINTETKIFEDLKFDDLDFVELLMDLEVKFNIHIPETDYAKCKTVGDIFNLTVKLT